MTVSAAASRVTARFQCSIDVVWLALVAAFPFVVLCFSALPVDDSDLWWTLALGRAVWSAGALPTTDPLAYTPTPQPYVYAQWLAGLILFGAWRLGGYELLIVLRAAIAAAAFGLLYLGCRRYGATPAVGGLCTLLAMPLVNVGLSLRPQILALIPFLLYLEGTRHAAPAHSGWGRLRRGLPLVMVFWVNVHGSFLFGLGLAGIALLGRVAELMVRRLPLLVPRRGTWQPTLLGDDQSAGRLRLTTLRLEPELGGLAWLCLLSALALLVNPYGIGFLGYLRDYLTVNPGHGELGGLLTEWQPTSLDTPGGPAFFVSVLVLLGGVVVVRRRLLRDPLLLAEAGRLLTFGTLACRWIRGIVWWGLVLPAPLAGVLQRALAPPGPTAVRLTSSALNGALVGLAGLVAVASMPWWRSSLGGEAVVTLEPSPVIAAAAGLAADSPPGHPFHYIAWGPYLAWEGGPTVRLFVDGRYEAYAPAVFADYARISRGEPGWEGLLDDYDVGYLLLSRSGQAGLVAAVAASAGWQMSFTEGEVVVYRREGSLPPAGRVTS
jgi:hypothetical protein